MRIRTIKPEFWHHEILAQLPEFTRLLAIGLLNYADDEGYFYASPQAIRGAVFPFLDDSGRITVALRELSNVGYIELGKCHDGRAVGRVAKFRLHQVINKPASSKIGPFSVQNDGCSNTTVGLPESSGSDTVGLPPGMEQGKEVEQGTGNRESPAGGECMAEEIYRAYPLKVGKPLAILKIKKALKDPPEGFTGQEWPQELLEITKRFAKARSGEDNGFTPHPSTWFNQRRFEDDPETWRRNAPANGYTTPQASRERAIQTTPMEDLPMAIIPDDKANALKKLVAIQEAKENGTYVPEPVDTELFEYENDPRDD